MARPRKDLTSAQRATIERMAKQGKSARAIAAALGEGVSAATVGRRAREVLGSRRAGKVKPGGAKAPKASQLTTAREAAEAHSDPVAGVEDFIGELDALIGSAKMDGNLAVVASGQRLKLSAIGLRERLRPTPPPDVEAFPDMVAAAAECRGKLREMIAKAIEEQGR
jgi:hypothetical protein